MDKRVLGSIFLVLMMGCMAHAKTCDDLLHNIEDQITARLIYTQDVFPVGPLSWDASLGYAHREDVHVWVVQMDLGPYSPRALITSFPNDGSEPDLKNLMDFFRKHGLTKGLKILRKDPTYFLTQY